METGSLIDIKTYGGEGFMRLVESDSWSMAFLRFAERFSSLDRMERHLLTEEVFVLLCGRATLFLQRSEGDCITEISMEANKLYSVPRGVWHHIVVSVDANVLVVENRNTSPENTEKRFL